MAGFLITNQMTGSFQAMTTTYKTLLRLLNAATLMRRQRITEIEVSSLSAPNATDCQVLADLTYCSATTAGTNTAITPLSVDSFGTVAGDVAVTTAFGNYSAEPTTTTAAQNWFLRAFNQRSGVLWQASPDKPVIMPSLASQGPLLRAQSTNYVGNVAAKLFFDEL